MLQNQTKLIILLVCVYNYFNVIKEVSCRGISVSEKYDNDKDDANSKVWRDKWKEHHKRWHMDSYDDSDSAPYINVVRGKSREWSNLEHSQPLKRSDDSAGFAPPPLTNDLSDLNMSNPISKYHCPINLLYGNNLTVKNYFLLVPRGNESSNDTVEEIKKVDEKFEYKAVTHEIHGAQGAVAQNETIAGVESPSLKEETAKEETNVTTTLSTTNETTAESMTMETNTTVTAELNTTVSETSSIETTITTESTTAAPLTTESTTAAPLTEGSTIAHEILRTLDKYCETFNMSDLSTYTIHPVNISIGTMEEKGNATNIVIEEKINLNLTETATNSSDLTALKKQKRTPKDGDNCANFNLSSNQNYTINPVSLPQGNKGKVIELKKQKRNFLSTRPKKI